MHPTHRKKLALFVCVIHPLNTKIRQKAAPGSYTEQRGPLSIRLGERGPAPTENYVRPTENDKQEIVWYTLVILL